MPGVPKYTNEDVLEAIRALFKTGGRSRRDYHNMARSSNWMPSSQVVTLRFGTWNKAVTAAGLIPEYVGPGHSEGGWYGDHSDARTSPTTRPRAMSHTWNVIDSEGATIDASYIFKDALITRRKNPGSQIVRQDYSCAGS